MRGQCCLHRVNVVRTPRIDLEAVQSRLALPCGNITVKARIGTVYSYQHLPYRNTLITKYNDPQSLLQQPIFTPSVAKEQDGYDVKNRYSAVLNCFNGN